MPEELEVFGERRPGVGQRAGLVGSLVLLYLTVIKIGGAAIGHRPLLTLGVLLVVVGIQLLSLGLLVATKAENHMQSLHMSMAFILPSVFFSGFIFPRETMPAIFYGLGAVLPTTYFIGLMRAIILRGATFIEYAPSLGILSLMAVLLFCVCALRFRKKIG